MSIMSWALELGSRQGTPTQKNLVQDQGQGAQTKADQINVVCRDEIKHDPILPVHRQALPWINWVKACEPKIGA
jgi:hypothetical protein